MIAPSKNSRRGQSLIEGSIVFLIFAALLIGAADCGQVLFAHESLVERANVALRWGTMHAWAGQAPVVNMVLYGQPDEPRDERAGYLGLTAENVVVEYKPATAVHPDDETLKIDIVDYESHLFSPWLARTLVSARPVSVGAPMTLKASAQPPAHQTAALRSRLP